MEVVVNSAKLRDFLMFILESQDEPVVKIRVTSNSLIYKDKEIKSPFQITKKEEDITVDLQSLNRLKQFSMMSNEAVTTFDLIALNKKTKHRTVLLKLIM